MKIGDRLKPKLPPVAPGVYLAVCIGAVDLGEQYFEKSKNYSNRIKYVWALPSEMVEVDGKMEERQLSREFSLASKKTAHLRVFLESWNCKTYTDEEWKALNPLDQIGKACQLQVALNDTGEYSNVVNLMPIPNGMPVPVSKTAIFKWDMDDWDDALFDSLPEWIQNQIKKSTQYQKLHAPETTIEVKDAPAAPSDPGENCPI